MVKYFLNQNLGLNQILGSFRFCFVCSHFNLAQIWFCENENTRQYLGLNGILLINYEKLNNESLKNGKRGHTRY